jgi:hypothetical protein
VRVLRVTGGALLWILASVVGLVAVLLCVTVVLLPLGIPLLALARRLFTRAIALFLPRAAQHPLKATGDAAKSATESVTDKLDAHKASKRIKKRWKKVANA